MIFAERKSSRLMFMAVSIIVFFENANQTIFISFVIFFYYDQLNVCHLPLLWIGRNVEITYCKEFISFSKKHKLLIQSSSLNFSTFDYHSCETAENGYRCYVRLDFLRQFKSDWLRRLEGLVFEKKKFIT